MATREAKQGPRPSEPATLPVLDAGPAPLPLDLRDTALLVIDMQKEFFAPGGYVDGMGYATSGLWAIVDRIGKLLDRVRGTDLLVIHTRYGKRPDLSDEPPSDIGRFRAARSVGVKNVPIFGEDTPLGRKCIKGETGWEFLDELLPIEGEPIIEKSTKSAFRFTDLELILRNQQRHHLLIAGITTDVCVMGTMRDANDLGYGSCLLTDCCAAATDEIHRAMVDHLVERSGIFGWWSESARLFEALEAAGVEQRTFERVEKSPDAMW